jgi:GTP-binding protein HflX
LVEAFKATLEEVVQAELLLHVVDVSHPQADEQIAAVNQVLGEIGAAGKPTIMVLNKIDQFTGNGSLGKLLRQFPVAVGVSAKTGEGIPALVEELSTQLRPIREFVELRVPHGHSAVIARLHEVAQVTERDYAGEEARFRARIPPHYHAEFAAYIVQEFHNGAARAQPTENSLTDGA